MSASSNLVYFWNFVWPALAMLLLLIASFALIRLYEHWFGRSSQVRQDEGTAHASDLQGLETRDWRTSGSSE